MGRNNRIVLFAPFSSDEGPLLDLLARDGFETARYGTGMQVDSLLDADGRLPLAVAVDAHHIADASLFDFLDSLFRYCLLTGRAVPTLFLLVDPAALDSARINRFLNARVDQLVDRDLDPERMARFLTYFLSDNALWSRSSDTAKLGLPESHS